MPVNREPTCLNRQRCGTKNHLAARPALYRFWPNISSGVVKLTVGTRSKPSCSTACWPVATKVRRRLSDYSGHRSSRAWKATCMTIQKRTPGIAWRAPLKPACWRSAFEGAAAMEEPPRPAPCVRSRPNALEGFTATITCSLKAAPDVREFRTDEFGPIRTQGSIFAKLRRQRDRSSQGLGSPSAKALGAEDLWRMLLQLSWRYKPVLNIAQ